MNMRKEYKEDFEKKHGIKLGFMSCFVKASSDALREMPAVNGCKLSSACVCLCVCMYRCLTCLLWAGSMWRKGLCVCMFVSRNMTQQITQAGLVPVVGVDNVLITRKW